MIVMRLDADNLCGFRNFSINFSYPKKIVGSEIHESLADFDNFRYKKINIILGTNASGKTALGKVMMAAFNFVRRSNANGLKEMIASSSRPASLLMDFVPDGRTLYRLCVRIEPSVTNDRQSAIPKVKLIQEPICKNDSYEKCAERLTEKENCEQYSTDISEVFKEVPVFGWYFTFPQAKSEATAVIAKKNRLFPDILKNVMMTLDSSIESVEKLPSSDTDYLMKMEYSDESILIHGGEIQDSDLSKVSSGTKAGVQIASFISAVKEENNSFYYCDEMFSYIQTDIEKAILSLLCFSVKDNDQLFFTTHNEDILDINLPKHSFIFMKKDHRVSECPIEAVDASAYLKKNNVSLKNAAENDLFSTQPNLDRIYEIEDMQE